MIDGDYKYFIDLGHVLVISTSIDDNTGFYKS